jgi:ubiquinone/menaquinone biosynthesis C-methylase UbiE
MPHLKFNMEKLERLNDPGRFDSLPPDVFWDALGAPAGEATILEIGAGTGLFAAAFAQRAPHVVVYAADMADQMLEWMRLNRPEVADERIIPVKASEVGLPLPDEMADAAYMINLHHELAEPAASYAEAFRLLKPGGRMLVVDWAPRETPKGPPLEVRARPEYVAELLGDAGFTNICVNDERLPWHWMVTAKRPRA